MNPCNTAAMLNAVPLFSSYSESEIQEVLQLSKTVHAAPGELLFNSGEPCRCLFVVLSGMIKLYKVIDDGHEKIIEVVEPGQSFAEAALFSGSGYPVSAKPLTEAVVLAIEGYAFTRFLQQHPRLTWMMLATLSQRLHHLVGQVENLTLRNAEQRIATYLLDNSDIESPECLVHHIPPRRSDLASLMGVTPETLCRIMTRMRKKGLIQADSGGIRVLDNDGLAALQD